MAAKGYRLLHYLRITWKLTCLPIIRGFVILFMCKSYVCCVLYSLLRLEHSAEWIWRIISHMYLLVLLLSLALSQLSFLRLFSVLPNPPDDFIQEIERTIYSFDWNGKPDKINRETLIGRKCQRWPLECRAFPPCYQVWRLLGSNVFTIPTIKGNGNVSLTITWILLEGILYGSVMLIQVMRIWKKNPKSFYQGCSSLLVLFRFF